MKKLKVLGDVIEQFQLTPQEVVQSFVNQKKLDSTFLEDMVKQAKSLEDVTSIPSEKFVTPTDIRAGMFEYQSGLISEELIPEEKLRGIVGYADDKEILVWCLVSKQLDWSENYWDAGTKDLKLRGWEATQKVLETAKKLGKTAPAAQWCVDYAEDGVEKGSSFLPSYADFERLMPNMEVVKKDFSKIGIKFYNQLWSSSEYNNCSAWRSYFNGSDGLSSDGKNYILSVRPVRRIVR